MLPCLMGLKRKLVKRILKRVLRRLLSDTKGATAVEYGLIAAGIACAAFAMILMTGDSLETLLGAAGAVFDGIVADSGF